MRVHPPFILSHIPPTFSFATIEPLSPHHHHAGQPVHPGFLPLHPPMLLSGVRRRWGRRVARQVYRGRGCRLRYQRIWLDITVSCQCRVAARARSQALSPRNVPCPSSLPPPEARAKNGSVCTSSHRHRVHRRYVKTPSPLSHADGVRSRHYLCPCDQLSPSPDPTLPQAHSVTTSSKLTPILPLLS